MELEVIIYCQNHSMEPPLKATLSASIGALILIAAPCPACLRAAELRGHEQERLKEVES